MAALALQAGGSMESGAASLTSTFEGIEAGVGTRRAGLGQAGLPPGGALGLMASKRTRMGSLSGAWMTRTRRWAPLMPRGPSCPSRYLEAEGSLWEGLPHSPLALTCLSLHLWAFRRAPRSPFLRSRTWTSRGWKRRRRSPRKHRSRRGLRQVSCRGAEVGPFPGSLILWPE